MTRKTKFILIGVGVLVMGGFVTLSVSKKRQPSVEVRLEKVERRDLLSVVTASGKIQPKRSVDVSSDITGRIVGLPVVEGQTVERGQVVVRIDPAQYQANVERAQAVLASSEANAAQARANRVQAERAYVRARDIRAQNQQLVSQEALEQAETQRQIAIANLDAAERGVDQARAALREAQDQLRKTTILAPMTGRVTRLAVEEGEVAVPGTFSRETGLLMTISDLSVIESRVQVDETDVVRVHLGDSVEVSIDAFPDTTFTGRVTKIGDSSIRGASGGSSGLTTSEQAVDFEVVITLDNPPRNVRPDLSATARIITDTRREVLSVPIIALTVREPEAAGDSARRARESAPAARQGATSSRDTSRARRNREVEGVFVVDTATMTARFHQVKVGIAGDEFFEVLSGLAGGETIVAGTYQAIRDLKSGAHVRAAREARAPGGSGGQDTTRRRSS
ncbi:MAG: efflux RND transporter periplasmic adaptor subunit [Gemmatimonadetes bacterium]|nr:efflux RND transporter periplasmic adaptor subunit [Gemmatimonadota bacterium]